MEHCSEIAKFTLMIENPLFEYRFQLSLISIFVSFLLIQGMSSNSVISIIISLIVGFIAYHAIEIYVGKSVDNNRLIELVERCQTEKKVKKENFRCKLRDMEYGSSDGKETNILSKEEENHFKERASISLEVANKGKVDSSFRETIGVESFTNPAAIQSTYKVLENDPIPNPEGQVGVEGCLLGKDRCNPLCSGSNVNSCNLQVATPGPQWQPQRAESVQKRLNNGLFVPARCPL
jgi:hypothetical protein